MSNITILCIEDEIEIRTLVVEELEDAGFKTLQASNGREGLEIILAKWPDIVICDIVVFSFIRIFCRRLLFLLHRIGSDCRYILDEFLRIHRVVDGVDGKCLGHVDGPQIQLIAGPDFDFLISRETLE